MKLRLLNRAHLNLNFNRSSTVFLKDLKDRQEAINSLDEEENFLKKWIEEVNK